MIVSAHTTFVPIFLMSYCQCVVLLPPSMLFNVYAIFFLPILPFKRCPNLFTQKVIALTKPSIICINQAPQKCWQMIKKTHTHTSQHTFVSTQQPLIYHLVMTNYIICNCFCLLNHPTGENPKSDHLESSSLGYTTQYFVLSFLDAIKLSSRLQFIYIFLAYDKTDKKKKQQKINK